MKKLLSLILVFACMASFAAPRHVTISKVKGGGWQMYVDGQPFFANGVSIYTSQNQHCVPANYGANTVRVFTLFLDSTPMLDKIAQSGMMCHAGLGFKSMRSGYYDKDEDKAIDEQEELILKKVRMYKDHPAILCWCIGNEFEISYAEKPLTAQWESIQRLAEQIHEIDPHHPVTLAVVDSYPPAQATALLDVCTALDFISCNGYIHTGKEFRLLRQLDELGWDKPFMTTELGPEGWWLKENLGSDRFAPWGAVVDYTSSEKEELYLKCMEMCKQDKRCIGINAFLWGWQTGSRDNVLEWYGMINKEGYTYGVVDILQWFWTGHNPRARAPRIESRQDITMDGKTADKWIQVQPGSEHTGLVRAESPSGVKLRYYWRIVAENARNYDNTLHSGISGLIADDGHPEIHFTAPYKPGAYRLFVHVYDDINMKAAYASIPFLVEGANTVIKLDERP